MTHLRLVAPPVTQRDSTLPLAEVFGPVWQGEGPYSGQRCSFVRLGLCNLACSWCDTPYTWDHTRYDVKEECPPTTVRDIADALSLHDTTLTVLTGGEPLIHQRSEALHALFAATPGRLWHVETNGTLTPTQPLIDAVQHFTVSPKLAHAGDTAKRRIVPEALAAFADLAREGRCAWKVVCGTAADVEEASDLMDDYRVPYWQRWVMPEGLTAEDVLRTARLIAPEAQHRRCQISLRTHVLLYGDKRAT